MSKKETMIVEAAQKLFLRHGVKKVSMSDIAEASNLSRPSLYAAFANKEAVIYGLMKLHLDMCNAESEEKLNQLDDLEDQLECLFNIWIIEPFKLAIESHSGKELMKTVGDFAPDALDTFYKEFEQRLTNILKSNMKKKSELSAKDVAHILSLATSGLKVSSETLVDLKRLVKGLIMMTMSFVK